MKRYALLLMAGVTGCSPATRGTQQQPAAAPASAAAPAMRAAYLDERGVVRWRDTDEEVRLFGANYALPSSGDYRAAGRLTDDRKALVEQDMAHFARMGWDGVRVAFWGDWQNADLEGNLIENDHLDVMDYLIAQARERGIYILFNPIHTYDAGWPDAMGDSFPGFAAHMDKSELGTDPAAIAAQTSYVRQIMEHVNPYTGVALADEPAILFVEMINEPHHHPEDLVQSVAYIDALVDAVRDAGSDAITFHNVSQDFRIAEAIRRSRVQGASFGWYPTGLNSGAELRGNHLRSVDDYPPMRMPALAGVPKVVYEFDSADQLTATMYPAMARSYRAGGVQMAAMFAYDMLLTASRNLGWQTHYLNMVYTPRKAMSAIIAAEVMRRMPRLELHDAYPDNLSFGPFRLDPVEDVAVMAAADAYMNAGSTDTPAPAPASLTRVAGYGSSPVVRYDGEGIYFLDRVRDGVWRLEVYPDAVPVAEPFAAPNVERIATRAIYRSWPMTVDLPGLGPGFTVQPVVQGNAAVARAQDGRFDVRPGVYVLSARGAVERASLPSHVGRVRFDEFVAPAPDSLGPRVLLDAPPEHLAGTPLEIEARVVTTSPPDSVRLWWSAGGRGWFRPFAMRRDGAYSYRATVPPDAFSEGLYEYAVSVYEGDAVRTFPADVPRAPGDWDYGDRATREIMVVAPGTPLRLLAPGADVDRLSFSRIGDGWRSGIFSIVPSGASGEPAFHLELPVDVDGVTPEDYRTSLHVGERIRARGPLVEDASGVRLTLRGIGPRQVLHVTLVERDGTGWSAPVEVGPEWQERVVPVARFRRGRAANLPMGFPGHWNYWLEPPPGRGGPGDAMRLADVERLQLALKREDGVAVAPGTYGVEVEWVGLVFD